MRKVKLKVNVDIGDKKAGDVLILDADKNGIILDPFWRRRLSDSSIDGCVSLVGESKKPKEKETQKDKGDKA